MRYGALVGVSTAANTTGGSDPVCDRRRVRALVFLVASAALVPFLRILPAYFVSDDFFFLGLYLPGSRPLPALAWHALVSQDGVPTTFYRPLPFVSLLLECRLWGPWPVGFHAVSLLLHALNALLVFSIALRLYGRQRAVIVAVVAALFAIHPRRIEPVCWISCRPDLLSALFALVSARLFLRATGTHRFSLVLASAAAWLAAVMSKEAALLVPLAFPFLNTGGSRAMSGRRRESVLPALPFALVLGMYLFARRATLGHWVGGYGIPRLELRVASSVFRYLAYTVVPPLEFLRRENSPLVLTLVGVVLGLLVLGLLAAVWRRRGDAAVRFGVAWALAAMAPVLLFPVSLATSFNDRLLYLASIGIALALPALLSGLRRNAALVVAPVAALFLAQTVVGVERWSVAGELAARLTKQLARIVATSASAGPLYLVAVPDSYRGAYVLRNGVAEGVALAGGVGVDRLRPLTLYLLDGRDRMPVSAQITGEGFRVDSTSGFPEVIPCAPSPGVSLVGGPPLDRFGRRRDVVIRIVEPGTGWVVGPHGVEEVGSPAEDHQRAAGRKRRGGQSGSGASALPRRRVVPARLQTRPLGVRRFRLLSIDG